jgi:N-acetylmuramoyl-L-alanine amidase
MYEIIQSRRIPAKIRKIKNIVIHCTATAPNTSFAHIVHYWRDVLGWSKAGYHYAITAKGDILQLAQEHEIVNGVKGHNLESIHVAYVGGRVMEGIYVDSRTPQQKEKLILLLRSLLVTYPNANILGHRDLSPDINGNGIIEQSEWIKECPLFNAGVEYKDLKQHESR